MSRYVWLGLFVALGGAVGWLVIPPASAPPRSAPLAAVSIAGKPLPAEADEGTTTDAALQAAQAWLDEAMTVDIAGTPTVRTRAQLGARIDGVHIRSLVAQLRDPLSALRLRRAPGSPVALPVPYALDTAAALAALAELKDELDLPPVDARFDFKTQQLSPDEPGRRIDVWGTLARLEDALSGSTTRIEAVVQTVAAKRTAARFSGVSTSAVLGWFETKYARDQKHEARTFNLRLAASRFDGYVLLPGETFDFNRVVWAPAARPTATRWRRSSRRESSSTGSAGGPARLRGRCTRLPSSRGSRCPSASPTRGRASTSRWASTPPSPTRP